MLMLRMSPSVGILIYSSVKIGSLVTEVVNSQLSIRAGDSLCQWDFFSVRRPQTLALVTR